MTITLINSTSSKLHNGFYEINLINSTVSEISQEKPCAINATFSTIKQLKNIKSNNHMSFINTSIGTIENFIMRERHVLDIINCTIKNILTDGISFYGKSQIIQNTIIENVHTHGIVIVKHMYFKNVIINKIDKLGIYIDILGRWVVNQVTISNAELPTIKTSDMMYITNIERDMTVNGKSMHSKYWRNEVVSHGKFYKEYQTDKMTPITADMKQCHSVTNLLTCTFSDTPEEPVS